MRLVVRPYLMSPVSEAHLHRAGDSGMTSTAIAIPVSGANS